MNKDQYLFELRTLLTGRVPHEELENILLYYMEYFQEAGPEQEQSVMAELGSPTRLTAQILGETPNWVPAYTPPTEEVPPRRRYRLGMVWTIVLAIFAAPIAIPLAIAAAAVLFALATSLLAVVFSVGAAALGCLLGGLATGIIGVCMVFRHGLATTILYVGSGLAALGVGILLSFATVFLWRWSIRGVAAVGRLFIRRKGGATL